MKTFMVTIAVLFTTLSAYAADTCDPICFDEQAIQQMEQRSQANQNRREQYLVSIIQQTYGGEVQWNDYQLAYVVCAGGTLNPCALGTPIDYCPKACASGTLHMCTTSTQITKRGIVDTIRCSGGKAVRLTEPTGIVQ